MKRILAVIACTALALVSCSDDSSEPVFTASTDGAASPTTEAPATSAATATSTGPATTAAPTTTAPTPTTAAPTTTTTLIFGGAVPSGSGCTPSGDVLPDGEWFGFIEDVDMLAITPQIDFDLACHFDGAQADVAAAWDGYAVPLEFYPYVRNRNPKVFVVNVSVAATVGPFMGGGTFTSWYPGLPATDGCSETSGHSACALWVKIESGVATSVYGVLPEWAGDGRD